MRRSILVVLCLLACSGVAPAQPAGEDVAGQISALQSADAVARIAAIDALGERHGAGEDVVKALAAQLGDADATVRAHAAHALGNLGEAAKPAAKELAPLIADPDVRVRRQAIRALVRIRPERGSLAEVIGKALDDATPSVRMAAARTLAEIGKPIVPRLIRALQGPRALDACLVLAEIGPDAAEAVPALVETVKSEKRPHVRREAVAALGAIGAAAAVPTLAEALADREPAVQLTAAFALGRIGPAAKEAHAALVKAQAQPDPVLQVVATWALIKSGAGDAAWKDKAIAWLAQKLMSSDAIVRTAAFRALAELRPGPQRVLPTIERVLQGADKHAAAEALSALAGLGEPAVPALVKALKLPEHRSAVVSILAHIGPPAKAAIPELLAVARDDKKASVRRDALLALGAIGADPAQAVPAALAALKDRSDRVQYAACSLLGKLGAAAAAAEPELRKLLDHQDEVLPMAAAWALVKINPTNAELAPKLVPLLIKALDQHDPLARCAAATALGELGPLAKDAAEPLKKKAAGDPDEHVRNLAAAAAAKVEKTP